LLIFFLRLLLAIATAPKLPKHEGELPSDMGKKIIASSSAVASTIGPKATDVAQKSPAAAKDH
jgi:hypothetical protein